VTTERAAEREETPTRPCYDKTQQKDRTWNKMLTNRNTGAHQIDKNRLKSYVFLIIIIEYKMKESGDIDTATDAYTL